MVQSYFGCRTRCLGWCGQKGQLTDGLLRLRLDHVLPRSADGTIFKVMRTCSIQFFVESASQLTIVQMFIHASS